MKDLYLVILFVSLVDGKVISGQLKTREDWVFLDRFCFLSLDGLFNYDIQFPTELGAPSLLMYPDLQWEDAYKNPKAESCLAKQNVLIPEKHQIIPLSIYSMDSGCEYVHTPIGSNHTKSEYKTRIFCKNTRSFSTARERWWFIAVANCNSSKGLEIEYKFRMTNGKIGDYWYEHFSADEFYILPALTSFCFTYLFLLFTALIFAVELKCRQLFHVTYKIFLGSLAAQTIGLILLSIFYARYASTGVHIHGLKLSGKIFESISEFLFILLLLLLGKGFTVTRGRLRLPSAVKLTLFLAQYFILFTFLFFFQEYFFDPGKVLYLYESAPGYGLLLLRLIGWLMFLYGVVFSLKHFPEKSPFYFPFALLYSIWFLAGPITVLAANHLIDTWVREKTTIITEHFVSFIGHISFLFLTRPSAANKSFPYHVRTTQVGAESSTVSLEQFQNAYAPSYIDNNGRTVDIFTVTGVLQRVEGSNGDVFGVPAAFRAPPPKYLDVFPHEVPGAVEEMLKEPDMTQSESSDTEDQTNSIPPRETSRETLYTIA